MSPMQIPSSSTNLVRSFLHRRLFGKYKSCTSKSENFKYIFRAPNEFQCRTRQLQNFRDLFEYYNFDIEFVFIQFDLKNL